MAHDEREYVKAKHGWSIRNLTGFRRTAEQIKKDETAFYNPKEFRQKYRFAKQNTLPDIEFKGTNQQWRIIFAILWIALAAFAAWTILQ